MRLTAALISFGTALAFAAGPLVAPLTAQVPAPVPAEPVMPIPEQRRGAASAGAVAGAVAVNVIRVPGKAILCGAGTLLATGLMLVTFGSQYRDAGLVFREGCGGKWVIGPNDLGRDVDAPKAIFSGEP